MTKMNLLISLSLALCIPFCLSVICLLGLNGANPALWYCWPGFFVCLLYTIGKEKTFRDMLNIVLSGIVGIIWAWLGTFALNWALGVMPLIPALFVGVGGMVFIFAVLMEPLPTLFNNYGFLYYLVAALFLVQEPFNWALIGTVGIGALYTVILFFVCFKFMVKIEPMALTMKPGSELEE